MPRAKGKTALAGQTKSLVKPKITADKALAATMDSTKVGNGAADLTKVSKEIAVKLEPDEDPPEKVQAPNLSQFKFEKRPHVKIEFEEELAKEVSAFLCTPLNWLTNVIVEFCL